MNFAKVEKTLIIAKKNDAGHLRIVIAGSSPYEIASKMGTDALKLPRVRSGNAFAIEFMGGHLYYVRRDYTGYRRLWNSNKGTIPLGFDVDHVLAKHICSSIAGGFILLALVEQGINRAHGQIEKVGVDRSGGIYLQKTFYMDERIYNKLANRKFDKNKAGYVLGARFDGDIPKSDANRLIQALGLKVGPLPLKKLYSSNKLPL